MKRENMPKGTSVSKQQEKEVDLREYFLVILKRRWLILTIVAVLVIGTLIYNLRQTPVYKSTAVLNIDRATYNFMPRVTSDDYTYQAYDSFFQTQYKVLQSFTLATRVQERLNLSPADLSSPGVKSISQKKEPVGDQAREQVAEQLLGMVQITPVKDTTLCHISFVSVSAEISTILANAWAEEYVDLTLDTQQDNTRQARKLLGTQVEELKREITEKEKSLREFSRSEQVVMLDDSRSMSSKTLEDLNSSLSQATHERIAAEVHYFDTRTKRKEAISEVTNHPVVQKLREDYTVLEDEYSKKATIFRKDYPELIALREQIKQNQERSESEMSRIYQEVLAKANAEYKEALNKENAIKKQVDRTKLESVGLSKQESGYDSLKLEVDDKKKFLEALLQKQSEADVNYAAHENKATTIRVVDKARLPKGIYKPNTRYNLMLALGISMILGVSLAFGVEYYLDRSLKNHHDVLHYVDLPFLGLIPKYTGEDSNGKETRALILRRKELAPATTKSVDLLAHYNPVSVAAEAFKSVRTSLLLSFPETPPKSILVTSSRPGEGKTFVASNLAISLAQLDKRVLLIDADMRNPRQHRVWGLPNHSGLSTSLTSDAKAQGSIHLLDIDGLALLTSGPHTPRPAELLSSKRFKEILNELEGAYDHVIIDAPPIMPVSDSIILAANCDCVVFVIHGGVTPRDVVQLSKNKLLEADAVVGGVILNCVNLNDPYYYYSYKSYSSYKYGPSKNGKQLES